MEEQIKFTHHTFGDGTELGDLMKKVLMEVVHERAQQGYVNEQEFLKKEQENL